MSQGLKNGTKTITAVQRQAAKATLERFKKVWVWRKRIVAEVIDQMAEGLEMKPREIMEEIGIETDEAAGVNVKDF